MVACSAVSLVVAPALVGRSSVAGAVDITSNTAGTFIPVAPTRVVDTRIGLGASAAMSGGGTTDFAVTGVGGVDPGGAGAVLVNLTVAQASAPGYLTAFAAGGTVPATSNVNFGPGESVANLAVVSLDGAGRIALYNGSAGTVQVVVDVEGYFSAGTPTAGFASVAPTRVLDTRTTASPMPAGGRVTTAVSGQAGVPAGATAAVVNLTVTQPASFGYLTAFADGSAVPPSSNLNFAAGQTVPNMAVVPLGADGRITIVNGSSGAAHVVVDVEGYLVGDPSIVGTFGTETTYRAVDTRMSGNPVAAGGHVSVEVAGVGGVPAVGVSSVLVNLTATQGQSFGYLTAFDDGGSPPATSDLNYSAGTTIANTAVVPVAADGRIEISNGSTGTVNVIVDVQGYFLGSAPGADATTFQESPAHDGVATGAPLSNSITKLWSRDVGVSTNQAGQIASPVIAGGRVFVDVDDPLEYTSSISAFDLRTGARLWGPIEIGGLYPASALAYDDGRLFSVNFNDVVTAYDPVTGRVEWTTTLSQSFSDSAPTAVGGVLYILSDGNAGTLSALDEATGAIRWQQAVVTGAKNPPTVDSSGVYVSQPCQNNYKFSFTGAPIWQPGPRCDGGGGRASAVHGGELWTRDTAVGSGSGAGEIIDANTGALVSSYTIDRSPPTFAGNLRIELQATDLLATDNTTNTQAWTFTAGGLVASDPLVSGNTVYTAASNGMAYGLDAATGNVIWQGDTGAPITSTDEASERKVTGNAIGDGALAIAGTYRITVFG